MKLRLPGLPTIVALGLAAMIAAWLGVFGPLDLTKLEKWQTLIAACVAAIGIGVTAYIAVRNVTKQIRVGILGREEDRIERELPGLRDARDFCSGFVTLKKFSVGITDAFRADGFGLQGSTLQKDVKNALPNTDPATRLRVQRRLSMVFRVAQVAEVTRKRKEAAQEIIRHVDQWPQSEVDKAQEEFAVHRKKLAAASAKFQASMDKLETEIADMDRKVALYERRLIRIRKEIEAYFDDEDE